MTLINNQGIKFKKNNNLRWSVSAIFGFVAFVALIRLFIFKGTK